MYQDLHFYIDLNWEKFIEDPKDYLQKLYKLVNFVYQHKATVFYSKEQIEEIKNTHEDLDKNFSQSLGNLLDLILENAKPKKRNIYPFEIVFSEKNTEFLYNENKAINVIDSYSKITLLSISETQVFKKLVFVKSNDEFGVLEFKVLNTLDSILKWVVENTDKREFNLSDKHGENGKGNWAGASPLLCNKSNAQILLNTAIPDFLKRGKQSSESVAWISC